MLVKKKNSNAFWKQKICSKRNSPPCIAVLHGSPFITIQAQRVNLYPICSRRVPLPIKPILLTSTKWSETYSGYDNIECYRYKFGPNFDLNYQ